MNNYICDNAQFFKNGLYQSIKCKATNDFCCCSRYCPTKRMMEHTEMAEYCLKNPKRKEYKK